MAVSSERRLLQRACEQKILSRWPDCEIVASTSVADTSIEFVIELSDGSVGIIDKKSAKSTVKSPLSRSWSLDAVPQEICRCLLKAVRLNRGMFHASYRPTRELGGKNKKQLTGFKISLSRQTSSLTWKKIFPDEPVPELAKWSVAGQAVKKKGQFLEVVHTLKNGKARQVNEYKLDIRQLSKAVYDSTLSFHTFPFNIPHSHRIIEGKTVTYDRPIEDWDLHVEQKGLLEDSTVQHKTCTGCGGPFYDTSTHELCFPCMVAQQSKSRDKALKLCKRAEALAPSSDWKTTAEAFKQLQQEWQQLDSMSREDSDRLWERFRNASQSFFDRRSSHFDDMDRQRLQNKRKAEKLIASAKRWLEDDDWRRAGEEIKSLQKQWKEVNPLPRECSEELWQEFRGYCQSFFDRSAAHYQKKKQQAQG